MHVCQPANLMHGGFGDRRIHEPKRGRNTDRDLLWCVCESSHMRGALITEHDQSALNRHDRHAAIKEGSSQTLSRGT